ncbi:class I SAM-dependent methyltransferase [Microvirga rosea]|uniref:class I SAM-dependent methyltransferase n=1 Tax=Microvirga rosea TaxID=2715425 RepID=UPI001D0AAB09|nr:class I SAM-dependent methyltransferase [Microvirga rosea]MCB8822671.1 class I SAM-dependent methyltransferase [Microvirga rosea]
MTRLDSAIRRLTAQRDLLDWATRVVAPTGLVLELGLGNGRTYDHLRARLPGREIYVFERLPAAHPDCLPAPEYLIVGDIFETLPVFIAKIGRGRAALVHADIGSGDESLNREVALRMSPLLDELLQPQGLLLADRAFALPHCEDVTEETGIAKGRYYVYRRRNEAGRAGISAQ